MRFGSLATAVASCATVFGALAAPPRPKLVYEGAFVIPTPDNLASVAVSPDGGRIAASYGDVDERGRYVNKVFLVDTWKPKRRRLVLVTDEVKGAAWSPDGRRLAICSASGLTVLSGLDPWFRTRAVQHLPLFLAGPILFAAKGDWLLAHSVGGRAGDFVRVRFDRLPSPETSQVHLENAYTASLIRYPGGRIAVVGQGIAVDGDGKAASVKPTGTIGLYNVHSDPVVGGLWFLTFDMDTASVNDGEVFEVTGTRAWLENVLTGRRIRLKWPRGRRVVWVQATGSASFCVQADDETLMSGRFDRFRRYRLEWK